MSGLPQRPLILPSLNPTGTPLWPPTGFALALFLLSGPRMWPAILLGSFSFSAIATRSLISPGFAAAGTALAGFAGAWLIDRWSYGRKTFDTPQGTAKFALVAFAPTALIGAIVALGGAMLAGDVDVNNLGGMARDRNELVARRRGRGPDHRSGRACCGPSAIGERSAAGMWRRPRPFTCWPPPSAFSPSALRSKVHWKPRSPTGCCSAFSSSSL